MHAVGLQTGAPPDSDSLPCQRTGARAPAAASQATGVCAPDPPRALRGSVEHLRGKMFRLRRTHPPRSQLLQLKSVSVSGWHTGFHQHSFESEMWAGSGSDVGNAVPVWRLIMVAANVGNGEGCIQVFPHIKLYTLLNIRWPSLQKGTKDCLVIPPAKAFQHSLKHSKP